MNRGRGVGGRGVVWQKDSTEDRETEGGLDGKE